MKIRFYFLSLFIFISFQSFACSCGGPPTFCEYLNKSWIESDLIVKGKKIRNVEHGFEFQISKIYRGEETKKTIVVWGDQGWLCRYYNGRFIDGEEYYMALIRLFEDTENSWAQSNPIGDLEKEGDYTISFCGKSYWHHSDEELIGETKTQVDACLNEINPDCEVVNTFEIEIDFCDIKTSEPFPNPTTDRIYVEIPDTINLSRGTARIFDDCGKLVRQYDDLAEFYSSNICYLRLDGLADGLYFIDINLPELCETNFTRRIVKK